MKCPKISVVVPAYNVALYLERGVRSLLAQTFRDFEVILVDDGSTDDTLSVMRRLAEQSGEIVVRIVTQENKGQSEARNAGMAVARGEFYYFLDSDDYLHPQALELAYRAISETKADFVLFDYKKIAEGEPSQSAVSVDGCSSTVWRQPLEIFIRSREAYICVWRFLYRRTAVGSLRFEPGLVHEDEYFTYQFLRRAKTGCRLKAQLYYYVQRPGSIMATVKKIKTLDAYSWIWLHLYEDFRQDADALELLCRTLIPMKVKDIWKHLKRDRRTHPDGELLCRHMTDITGRLMRAGVLRLGGFSLRWKLFLVKCFIISRCGMDGAEDD